MGFLSKLFGGGPGNKKTKVKVASLQKRWDLQGRTGQGSMSRVFKAYDREMGRTICLKLMDKDKTKAFEARFKLQGLDKPSEGEICVQFKHKNCVTTYEHGVTNEGEPYLVMEWIDGLGLNYLVETRNALLTQHRANYMGQLAEAVQYLHGAGFLHRDLCPRNVMVDKNGVVKLIDFGLAVPFTPAFCQPGNRTGTIEYMAPEIVRRGTTDQRVDVFALGVTAFEVFTGAQPWERSASSEETLRKRLNVAPRRAKDLNPELSDALAAALTKSIHRDRNHRYDTADEFRQALLATPEAKAEPPIKVAGDEYGE